MKLIPKTTTELIRNIKRTVGYVWRERPGLVVTIFIFSLLASLVPFATSASRAFIIDQLIASSSAHEVTGTLGVAVVLLLAASFLPSLLYTVQRYLGKQFWFFTDTLFEMAILKKRGELDVAIYESPTQNDLLVRVNENGVWRLQNFTDRQFYIIQDIVQVATASVILGAFHWWLVVVLLAGTLPELVVEMRYGKDTWGIYGAKAEVRRRYWSLRRYFDGVEGVVELRLFQNLRNFLSKIKALFLEFQSEQKSLEKKKLIAQLCTVTLAQVAIVIVVWWSVLEVVHGQVLVGVFTFLLASIGDFRAALSSLFQNMARQYEDSLFVTDIFTLLSLEPVLQKPIKAVKLSKNKTPDIVFEDVSFAYPNTEKLVLEHINLHIPAGHKLALVGVNGSGKTTLVKLLCRFYDPTRGRILVNGVDLKDIDIETWYGHMGILFQQYAQYRLPVKESIAQGDSQKKFSFAEVKEAAKQSESAEFIESWPDKYDQMLGREFSGGLDPSIGQWQKLALARVFYRRPSVFVLDEPTASIDAEAEAHIFERLEKVAAGKTMLLISHRFSTVRKADTICVIKNGRVHEQGTHAGLLAKKGTYAKLFHLQAKGYE